MESDKKVGLFFHCSFNLVPQPLTNFRRNSIAWIETTVRKLFLKKSFINVNKIVHPSSFFFFSFSFSFFLSLPDPVSHIPYLLSIISYLLSQIPNPKSQIPNPKSFILYPLSFILYPLSPIGIIWKEFDPYHFYQSPILIQMTATKKNETK